MRLPATTGVPAVLLIVCGLALSACGSAGTTTTIRTTGHAVRPGPRRHRGAPGRPPAPRVGAAQLVSARGTTLAVTVRTVIDPLRGSGAAVPPGLRPVGIVVFVHNRGPGGYDSSATGDFSLLSAAGPASPVEVPSGPCQTQVQDFMNAISAGESRMGCVAFAIPSRQAPRTVRFSPNGGATGHSLSWVVK